MLRIKLFALFIAFALLALVRPRKCLELLEAADRGVVLADAFPTSDRAMHDMSDRLGLWLSASMHQHGDKDEMTKHIRAWLEQQKTYGKDSPPRPWPRGEECPLPPAGWRCTRRAGHDGPCAAVVVK